MGSYWWYITVIQRSDDATMEEIEEILFSAAEISGSTGTELQELPDGKRMRIYYRSDEELHYWRNKLLDALEPWPGVKIEDVGKIENQPWSQQCEEAFPPLAVGDSLVVLAPWHRGTEPQDRTPLYINPGSAFGTGYHESTQAALHLLENYVRDNGAQAIKDVIDVGTGSGILTIAAFKFGAESVISRDLDPAVIEEAWSNFELNGVESLGVTLETGDLLKGVSGKADLLIANILLDPLMEMLPDVVRVLKPGGAAIFSGMTQNERETFKDALSSAGFSVIEEMTKEEWWGVAAKSQA